jgi:thiol-disulfide isomerase/thioredoxin
VTKKLGLILFVFGFVAAGICYLFFFHFNQDLIRDERVSRIFKMRDLNNDPIKSIKTDFVIINFWASWCPPCIEETPSLVRFTEKYANQFTLVVLSQDSIKKDIEDFIKTFPSLRSPFITIIHDDSQSVAHSFEVDKLPETYIYSIQQNKYFRVSGATNWDQPDVVTSLNKFFNINL